MKPAPPITQARIDAFAASAFTWLGWLLAVILRLGAPKKSRRLIRFVQACERHVEATVLLLAIKREMPPSPPSHRRPIGAPMGFRRVRARRRRLLYKHARISRRSASLHARVERLVVALANPEPYIARFAKRLSKRLRVTSILAVAPPTVALTGAAPRQAAFADSS